MAQLRLFVNFDKYETEAIRKVLASVAKAKGQRMTPEEFVKGAVRYAVHDLMPRDFMLGPDAKEMLKDVLSGKGQRA